MVTLRDVFGVDTCVGKNVQTRSREDGGMSVQPPGQGFRGGKKKAACLHARSVCGLRSPPSSFYSGGGFRPDGWSLQFLLFIGVPAVLVSGGRGVTPPDIVD